MLLTSSGLGADSRPNTRTPNAPHVPVYIDQSGKNTLRTMNVGPSISASSRLLAWHLGSFAELLQQNLVEDSPRSPPHDSVGITRGCGVSQVLHTYDTMFWVSTARSYITMTTPHQEQHDHRQADLRIQLEVVIRQSSQTLSNTTTLNQTRETTIAVTHSPTAGTLCLRIQSRMPAGSS